MYKLETIDWLFFSLEKFAGIKKNLFFKNLIFSLRQRLKYGIKEGLLNLIKIKWIRRRRARKLFDNGIKNMEHILCEGFENLSKIIDHKIAKKIKNEEDIKENKEEENKIRIRNVSSDEIEQLLVNDRIYEEDKKKFDKSLFDYF
jgi:helicase